MIIKRNCPTCNKPSDLKSESKYPTFILMTFKCGHSLVEPIVIPASELAIMNYESIDKKKLFKFQQDGVNFVFKSNIRCLIADEMGLGKTVQGLAPIALEPKLLPCLVICKSVATGNWSKHTMLWAKKLCNVIGTSKDVWHSVFPIHIISYDLLTRIQKEVDKSESKHQDYQDYIKSLKLVIIDETHLIKNPNTGRATAVKKVCSEVEHIIGLSGTPIKNNATELFTILNILHPEKYWKQEAFCRANVQTIWDGKSYKWGGLRNPEAFKRETESFIIRRTMDEVMPDIPKLFRHPTFVELEGEVNSIYQKEQEEFAEYFDSSKDDVDFMSNILAKMARLRHITSLAKIDLCVDTVMEFLYSNNRKLAIFTHHLDARDILAERLNRQFAEINNELGNNLLAPCLVLANNDKDQIEKSLEDFKNGEKRVIILSTLSHGESLNMQFCSDSILHERQWNPANEDQAISGRFRRIGQEAERINCNILIAIGTIDEYYAELVERKRQYFDETVNGKRSEESWNETSLIMELAELLASKGRKKWKIA